MKGPTKKKMPDKEVCTGCDVLISKELGGTDKFPKKWTVNYCGHEKLEPCGIEFGIAIKVALIQRGIPYTPKWCPERGE